MNEDCVSTIGCSQFVTKDTYFKDGSKLKVATSLTVGMCGDHAHNRVLNLGVSCISSRMIQLI